MERYEQQQEQKSLFSALEEDKNGKGNEKELKVFPFLRFYFQTPWMQDTEKNSYSL